LFYNLQNGTGGVEKRRWYQKTQEVVHFKTHTSFAGKEFWCFSLHFLSSEAESLLLVITDFEANDMTSFKPE